MCIHTYIHNLSQYSASMWQWSTKCLSVRLLTLQWEKREFLVVWQKVHSKGPLTLCFRAFQPHPVSVLPLWGSTSKDLEALNGFGKCWLLMSLKLWLDVMTSPSFIRLKMLDVPLYLVTNSAVQTKQLSSPLYTTCPMPTPEQAVHS